MDSMQRTSIDIGHAHERRFFPVREVAGKLPQGWIALSESESLSYQQELARELTATHQLAGLRTTAIARREGRDEFLFQIHGHHFQYAKVQLTWSAESDPKWPWTEVFNHFEQWLESTSQRPG